MKALKYIPLFLLFASAIYAGVKKIDTVLIKTSAICNECKERIETALAYEKGIIQSDVNFKTGMVSVVYKDSKTNPDKIRKAISEIGYDADNVKADPKSYAKLPKCCKKE